jgi:hypothetical protein
MQINSTNQRMVPGRVTGRNFQPRADEFSGAGQELRNSSDKWLRKTGQVKATVLSSFKWHSILS